MQKIPLGKPENQHNQREYGSLIKKNKMEKMKKAIWITIAVTVAYVLMLTFLGKYFPTEKNLVVYNWVNIKLPFEVSPWWFLLLCPMMIFLIIYGYSRDAIVGQEPRRERNDMTNVKYHVRFMIYFTNLASMIIALGTASVAALFWAPAKLIDDSFSSSDSFGPVSMAISLPIIWLVIYVVIGFIEESVFTLGWNTSFDGLEPSFGSIYEKEEGLWVRFKMTFVNYEKKGIIKSMPHILGMVSVFILRIFVLKIQKIFKALKQ
jgi:hypothetical protein